MKAARGFRYAFEPVRQLGEWALQDSQRELAAAIQALAEARARAGALAQELERATAAWNAQMDRARVAMPMVRLAHAYLGRLHAGVAAQHRLVAAAERRYGDATEQHLRLRRQADAIDAHRDDAVADHLRERARIECQHADDMWLLKQPRRPM